MSESESLEPLVVTPGGAAQLLSMSRARVYELIKLGTLKSHKIGKLRRIDVVSIRRLLAATAVVPRPARRRRAA